MIFDRIILILVTAFGLASFVLADKSHDANLEEYQQYLSIGDDLNTKVQVIEAANKSFKQASRSPAIISHDVNLNDLGESALATDDAVINDFMNTDNLKRSQRIPTGESVGRSPAIISVEQ